MSIADAISDVLGHIARYEVSGFGVREDMKSEFEALKRAMTRVRIKLDATDPEFLNKLETDAAFFERLVNESLAEDRDDAERNSTD